MFSVARSVYSWLISDVPLRTDRICGLIDDDSAPRDLALAPLCTFFWCISCGFQGEELFVSLRPVQP